MSPQEVTKTAKQIRAFIVENELENAFKLLMNLAENADGNYWDESVNLNQDFTKLKDDTRSGLLTPIQSETNTNRLIDKMLKLTRVIETETTTQKFAPNHQPKKGDTTITKTITVSENSSSNLPKILFAVFGLIGLLTLAYIFLGGEEKQDLPTPKKDNCETVIEEGKSAFKAGDLDKAERIFITAKDACLGTDTAEKWIERVEVQRKRIENSSQNAQNPGKEGKDNNQEKTIVSPNKNLREIIRPVPDLKKETNKIVVPVQPTFPTEGVDSEAAFRGFVKEGKEAFDDKNYVKAYNAFKNAKTIKPNDISIGGKLEDMRNLCYRQFFQKGMDYYNAKEYAKAIPQFQEAGKYSSNGIQVKGMLRRCEEALY